MKQKPDKEKNVILDEADAARDKADIARAEAGAVRDVDAAKGKGALFYSLALLLVAALWGTGNSVLKLAIEVLPPLYCLTIRFFLAFAFFLLIACKRVIPKLKKDYLMAIVAMSLSMGVSFVTSAYALKFTTAVNAGFFMSTAVIFTPLLGRIFLKTKLHPKVAGAIAVVVIGMFILSTANGSISLNLGDGIAILCAIGGAFMFITGRLFVHNIDPVLLTVMQIGGVAFGCLVCALVFEKFPGFGVITLPIWGAFVYMALFCTCLAFVAQNISLKHVSENHVALIFCMEPVFGAVAAFFMLGEMLNVKGLIGAAIIMAGVVIATLTAKPDEA